MEGGRGEGGREGLGWVVTSEQGQHERALHCQLEHLSPQATTPLAACRLAVELADNITHHDLHDSVQCDCGCVFRPVVA